MISLDYFRALILGVIQGLTEFLPVSSSAHLAVAQKWMGLDPESLTLQLFDGFSHIGTLIAVAYVFLHPILRYLRRLLAETKSTWTGRRYAMRIAGLGIVASIPTAAIGLGLKKILEAAFGNMLEVGIELIITGGILVVMAWIPRGRRGWRDFSFRSAFLIGVAQGVAIFPGISRSGTTICTAAFLGIRRRWAVEFSFLISFPAIVGATMLVFKDALDLGAGQFDALPWGPIVVGSLTSLVVGVVSLRLLIGAVRKAKLHYFAVYCWLAGAVIVLSAVTTTP